MKTSTQTSLADNTVIFDSELISRYDVAGPRYTSYPTAPQFHEGYNQDCYKRDVKDSNGDPIPRPLSLYFHLPFCAHVCFYCACNKIITANRSRADKYVDYLIRELHMHAELFDSDRYVSQLHWGGGTPTFLHPELMKRLMEETRRSFNMEGDDAGEYSIEIDPREADSSTIHLLRDLRFNRMSVGIQDFDPAVQEAVNRQQSFEETEAVINAARECGFRSVSVDLIYGLPYQNINSFERTLEKILELKPDRIAAFNYAHLPQRFKSQRYIKGSTLPSPQEKLDIFVKTVEKLTAEKYVYIGMDHFALPDDDLTVAQQKGVLHRNFQGYSTHGDCDLIGMGVSSIGITGDSYTQNVRDIDEYYSRVESGNIPVFRGIQMTSDDLMRRDIIMSLICNFKLNINDIEQKHGIHFTNEFAEELGQLYEMQEDGLLQLDNANIVVMPRGRFLIRNICMVFDAYLQKSKSSTFSKII